MMPQSWVNSPGPFPSSTKSFHASRAKLLSTSLLYGEWNTQKSEFLSETRSPLDFASPRTPAATTHPFNMTSPCAASPLATFASASAPGSVAKLRGGTERLDAILHELRTAKAAPRNLGRIARILNVNMGEGEEGGGEEGTNRRRRGLGKLFADSDEEESDVEQSGKGLSEANVVAVS